MVFCNPPPPPLNIRPVAQPGSGDPCTYVGPACPYGDSGCAGMPIYYATCQGSQWAVSFATGSCNPPPPMPCPTVAPVSGDACSVAPGTICSQSPTCTEDGFEAECVAGVWKVGVAHLLCDPSPPGPYDSGLPMMDIEGGVAADGGPGLPNR